MSYGRRLLLSTGLMMVGMLWSVLVVATGQPPATESGAPVFERVCQQPPASSLNGALAILARNSAVAASLLIGGLLIGIRLAVQLMYIGFDAADHFLAAIQQSHSPLFAVAGLTPHGLLELPALCCIGATGAGVTNVVFRFLVHRERPTASGLASLARELPLAWAALLAAAMIEEFVTPLAIVWAAGC